MNRILLFHSTCCYFEDTVNPLALLDESGECNDMQFLHLCVGSGMCTYYAHIPDNPAQVCMIRQARLREALSVRGASIHNLDDYLPTHAPSVMQRVNASCIVDGINLTNVCRPSLAAYLQWEDFDVRSEFASQYELNVVDSFINDAARYLIAIRNAINELHPTHCFLFNGNYYIERLMLEQCRILGVLVFGVESSTFRDLKVISQTGATGNRSDWRALGFDAASCRILTSDQKLRLSTFMTSKFDGFGHFIEQPQRAADARKRLNLDCNKPTFLFLGQVPHDSTMTTDLPLFNSLPSAVAHLLQIFSDELRDCNLIVRTHPGGIRDKLVIGSFC
jgi:hypothetical protein